MANQPGQATCGYPRWLWHEGWDATPGMSEEARLVSGEVEEVAGALSSTKVH